MFDSARSTLDTYIDTDKLSRFTFYSVEMKRGDNLEDLYYLCTTKYGYYVVFETDYILNSLIEVAEEAADIFKADGLSPLHWLVKKDCQSIVGASIIPIDAGTADELRKNLISDKDSSPMGYAVRHGVIEFTGMKNPQQPRFNPATYGNVS